MATYTNTFGTPGNDALTARVRPEMLFGGAGNDTLTSNILYDNFLLGGSGDDTYVTAGSLQNVFIIETGGDPADRAVDIFSSWPAPIMGTLDGRHLVLTNYSATNNVIVADWQKPENVIEWWTFKGQTMSYIQFVQAVQSSANYYGNFTLDRLSPELRGAFNGALAEATERSAWYDGVTRASITATTPTAGNDSLTGNATWDTISGGAGDDTIDGADGADILYGNTGADVLVGSQGRDTLYGGDSTDILYGNQDIDRLEGEAGDDFLFGGQGDDSLFGGAGADVLYGNMGNDFLSIDGNDTAFGGQGNDNLVAGREAAVLYGNVGDDRLLGVAGSVLYGGAGADRFQTSTAVKGNTVVADFNGAEGDRIAKLSSDSLVSVTADSTGNAVLTFNSETTVTLLGVPPASFSDSWIVAAS